MRKSKQQPETSKVEKLLQQFPGAIFIYNDSKGERATKLTENDELTS